MPLQLQQRLSLRDGQHREFGQVLIDRVEGALVFGRFTPGPEFASVERLFANYVEAANEQLLGIVGELDAAIGTLGLYLFAPGWTDLPAIQDVQIAAGGINFRTHVPKADGQSQDQIRKTDLPRSTVPPEMRTSQPRRSAGVRTLAPRATGDLP